MTIQWLLLHPRMTEEHLGFLPYFIQAHDERGAVEQIAERYKMGGWNSFKGFTHKGKGVLAYKGDPDMSPIASAKLRDETIYLYPSDWVAVFQPDGSFDIARID